MGAIQRVVIGLAPATHCARTSKHRAVRHSSVGQLRKCRNSRLPLRSRQSFRVPSTRYDERK
jgi:hypothetical protein